MPIMNNLGNLQYVLIAIVGGALAIFGIAPITAGIIASFLQLSKNFTRPFSEISQQINAVIMALAGAERIFELMDEESEQDEGYVTLVNAKEDEEPKLLCDRVRNCPKTPDSDKQNSQYDKTAAGQQRAKPQRLYIKFPSKSCKEYVYAKKLLAVFDGTSPVSFYYSDTKEYEHLSPVNNVHLNDVMINELKRVLGEGAIVVK